MLRFNRIGLSATSIALCFAAAAAPALAEEDVQAQPLLAQAQEEPQDPQAALDQLDALAKAEPPAELSEQEIEEWAAQSALIEDAQFAIGEMIATGQSRERAEGEELEIPSEVTDLANFTVVSPDAVDRQEQALEIISYRALGIGGSFGR